MLIKILNCLLYHRFRLPFSWMIAKKTLVSYLDTDISLDARQKCRCYFMLGKMVEKQNPAAIKDMLTNYLLAEGQLFDLDDDDDDTVLWMKIEISFRITASIYKFVVGAEKSIDEHELLIKVLKRDKSRLFNVNQLTSRAHYVETVDENANKIDGQQTHQVSINESNMFELNIVN